MSPERPAYPRTGLAIGAVVLAGWLGAIGVAIASDDSRDAESRAAPSGAGAEAEAEAPVARPGRAGPGYQAP